MPLGLRFLDAFHRQHVHLVLAFVQLELVQLGLLVHLHQPDTLDHLLLVEDLLQLSLRDTLLDDVLHVLPHLLLIQLILHVDVLLARLDVQTQQLHDVETTNLPAYLLHEEVDLLIIHQLNRFQIVLTQLLLHVDIGTTLQFMPQFVQVGYQVLPLVLREELLQLIGVVELLVDHATQFLVDG